MTTFRAPAVLVLGGGGVLGEAWMSAVLAGIEEAAGFDACGCDGYVGTSAGSIVAAALAAGTSPHTRLGDLPEQPPIEDHAGSGGGAPAGEPPFVAASADGSAIRGVSGRALRAALAAGEMAAAPLASLALSAATPGGAFVRRAALGRVPAGRRSLAGLGSEIERLGTRFDGRLAMAAVELDSGRRVMFGQDDAPPARVGEAVEASCAIPGYFRPVEIGGREYVDGGAWSPTNMDTAPATRGTTVLCLNPTGSMGGSIGSPARAIGLASQSLAKVEALALRRRGAHVTTIAPDAATLAAIGGNLMDPRPRSKVIAAGLEQGRRIARG